MMMVSMDDAHPGTFLTSIGDVGVFGGCSLCARIVCCKGANLRCFVKLLVAGANEGSGDNAEKVLVAGGHHRQNIGHCNCDL